MSTINPNRLKVVCCPPYGSTRINGATHPMRGGGLDFSRRALREEMVSLASRHRRAALCYTVAPVWMVGGADIIVLPTVSYFRKLCMEVDGDRLRCLVNWYIQAKSSQINSARLIVYVNSFHELEEAINYHVLGMVEIVSDLLAAEAGIVRTTSPGSEARRDRAKAALSKTSEYSTDVDE